MPENIDNRNEFKGLARRNRDYRNKFDRMLYILNLLDRREQFNRQALCEAFRVSERTVDNYLRSLDEAKFPISYVANENSYRFPEGYSLSRTHLSREEVLALALARRSLSPYGASLDEALNKLEKRMLRSSPQAGTAEALAGVLLVSQDHDLSGISQEEGARKLFELARACMEHRLVWLNYISPSSREESKREVEPYSLYFAFDCNWYLRAYCRQRNGWRIFALDGIRKWEILLDKHFGPRLSSHQELEDDLFRGFDTYMDGEKVETVLLFSPEIRGLVERRVWHRTQQNRDLPDGWLELTMSTTGIEAVKHWIYRWIPHVIIVKPEDLYEEVYEELTEQSRILAKYHRATEPSRRVRISGERIFWQEDADDHFPGE